MEKKKHDATAVTIVVDDFILPVLVSLLSCLIVASDEKSNACTKRGLPECSFVILVFRNVLLKFR